MTNRIIIIATILLQSTTFLFGQNLTCTIKSDKLIYKASKIKKGGIPDITVEFKNNTDSIVNIVKTLDGSSRKLRFPYAYFKIEKVNDTSYKSANDSECGNYDGIKTKDFITLNPGSTYVTYNKQNPIYSDYNFYNRKNFEKKGKYKITFYYSTNEPNFKYWMGDPYAGQRRYWFDSKTGEIFQQYKDEYQTLLSLFSKVPKIALVSNEILIEVK